MSACYKNAMIVYELLSISPHTRTHKHVRIHISMYLATTLSLTDKSFLFTLSVLFYVIFSVCLSSCCIKSYCSYFEITEYKCDSPKVYEACGAVVEPTCDYRYRKNNASFLMLHLHDALAMLLLKVPCHSYFITFVQYLKCTMDSVTFFVEKRPWLPCFKPF